jgi:photosystem II stability/assembly factor-like uncharacterized protein
VLSALVSGVALGIDAHWKHVGPFAAGGLVRGLAIDPGSAHTAYAATDAGVFKTTDGGALWQSSSRGLPLASITVVEVDPSDSSVLYCAPIRLGVFRSSDGGENWEAAGSGLPPGADVQRIAIDHTGTLFAGIVYARDGLLAGGVFKSIDHGQTWTDSSQGLIGWYALPAIAANTPSVAYAVTDVGIFRTTDAGEGWTQTSTLQSISDLVVDPGNVLVVYALSSLGVSNSVDGGVHWTAKNLGLPESSWATDLAIDPTRSATLYLTTTKSVFKSTDRGETWTPRADGIETADLCPAAIALAPSAPSSLYLGNQCAGGVFRSDDAAVSWKRTDDAFAPPAVAALVPDGGSGGTLAATSRGVYRIEGGGVRWTALDAGLEPDLGVISLAQAPSDARRLYAGTDSGGLYRSDDAGSSWSRTTFTAQFLANLLAVDPASSSTVYAAAWDTLSKSTDAGDHFAVVRAFPDGLSTLVFHGGRLYAGTSMGEIWSSDGGGETWILVGAVASYTAVTTLAFDPHSPSMLYASAMSSQVPPPLFPPNGGVYKSADGGASWQVVEAGIGLTSLLVSPADSSILYAAGFRGTAMRSTDAGATWEPLTGLPDGWVGALAINPGSPNTLYAGMAGSDTAIGVFTLDTNERSVRLVGPSNRETRAVARPE